MRDGAFGGCMHLHFCHYIRIRVNQFVGSGHILIPNFFENDKKKREREISFYLPGVRPMLFTILAPAHAPG